MREMYISFLFRPFPSLSFLSPVPFPSPFLCLLPLCHEPAKHIQLVWGALFAVRKLPEQGAGRTPVRRQYDVFAVIFLRILHCICDFCIARSEERTSKTFHHQRPYIKEHIAWARMVQDRRLSWPEITLIYLSGLRARSSRKTRRMPKIRGLVDAVSEMTRSTSEMNTKVPSMTFQPLRRQACSENAIPLAITCSHDIQQATSVIEFYRLRRCTNCA